LVGQVADALARSEVVGWFDGRMEFGPRALGARSILADPRDPRMQATLNLKIKFREGFRPFAPSVLAERAGEYFELDAESPYMLLVSPVQPRRRLAVTDGKWGIDHLNEPRSDIPAVTHLDYTARVQTVTREQAPGLREVIEAFDARTGCPVLVNTSFNVRGEPIVCTPRDAYQCFMRTRIDVLAMPPFLLRRSQQPTANSDRWQTPLPLD
jgi:carbamoyltransferase